MNKIQHFPNSIKCNYSAAPINYKFIDDEANLVVSLICNCCQREIQPHTHVEHLKLMAELRWNENSKPNANDWFRRFEMDFLKTKVVFSNGLVLYKQNLIKTNIGNYAGFFRLAEQIFQSLERS